YGPQPPALSHVSEEYTGGPDVTDPHWVYGEGKRLAEMIGVLYSRRYSVECTIARPFAFVGPYLPLDRHLAIGNFLAACLAGRSVQIRGDGTPLRSYLYAADLAIWLWTILVRGQSGRAYNVGSEDAISIADLAVTVRGLLNLRLGVTVAGTPVPDAPAE